MGKGSTRRPGRGFRENYDRIVWEREDEDPAPVAPYANIQEKVCGAKQMGYTCNAAKGHDGLHAAYGGDLTVPRLAWR